MIILTHKSLCLSVVLEEGTNRLREINVIFKQGYKINHFLSTKESGEKYMNQNFIFLKKNLSINRYKYNIITL